MKTAFNDLRKDAVRRALGRFGIRLQKAAYLPFSYNQSNYPLTKQGIKTVIFDVGANIGQSAAWYAEEFPEAEIHSFEPFECVHDILIKTSRDNPRIIPHKLALGDSTKRIEVARVRDPFCQTGSIAADESETDTEWIEINTVDEVASRLDIQNIHILKTDTEGHDLEVLAGADQMLKHGKIASVLSEATILSDDRQHTQLEALQAFLRPHDLILHGIYDLHHSPEDGQLSYFNALFVRKPSS